MNKYLLLLIFVFSSFTLSAAKQKKFSELDDSQKKIHLDLYLIAMKIKEEQNHFAVIFRFIFEDKSEICVPFPDHGNSFFSSGINCKQPLIEECHSCLCTTPIPSNPADHGLSDSEFAFISYACNFNFGKSDIFEPIRKKISGKAVLEKIEIHGFSTRDMCTNCCAHLEKLIQTREFIFLVGMCTMSEVKSLPKIEFYVSSLVPFGHEYKDSDTGLYYVFLHDETGRKCVLSGEDLENRKRMEEEIESIERNIREKEKTWDEESKKVEKVRRELEALKKQPESNKQPQEIRAKGSEFQSLIRKTQTLKGAVSELQKQRSKIRSALAQLCPLFIHLDLARNPYLDPDFVSFFTSHKS